MSLKLNRSFHRTLPLLLAVLAPWGLIGGCPSGGSRPVETALVVYNANANPDASTIANYYATKRGIPPAQLCSVELPPGQYGSAEHLLGARRTILEDCICALIPEETRPVPCDTSNVGAVRAESKISHLVLVKGIPPRLYGTGWPSDSEEPSFDFYLSAMIYRKADLFAPGKLGLVTSSYLDADMIEQGNELMILSAPPLDPALHRDLAYGRIEAIDLQRTLDLIDRTLDAEKRGLTGNFLEEDGGELFDVLRETTGSHAAECSDYIDYEPFVFDTPESSWPSDACRTGTTFVTALGPDPGSTSDDPVSGVVPGSLMSTVPRAVNVGLFLGHAIGPNLQSGFNSFDVLTNWRKANTTCEPLCADLPTQAERDACVAGSTDYFGELNTDCVGMARGAIGHQVRSYPVQYYGFLPAGWTTNGSGAVEKTPARLLEGGAYQDPLFPDDGYLHLGTHSVNDPDQSQCTLEDGSVEACPERIALSLERRMDLAPALPVVGSRDFQLRVRHRNPANPGGDLRIRLQFFDGASQVTKTVTFPLDLEQLSWATSQISIQITDAELTQVTRVDLELATRLTESLYGFLDLDGIELEDLATGAQLLPLEAGSFDPPSQDTTHPGDYAANAIDRLGAVAWWGSASHHLTQGWAFSHVERFTGAFLMGRTLGESLLLTGDWESGIIYGDPLYRPSAARMHIPGENYYGSAPGLLVRQADLPDVGTVYLNVLHGTANLSTVSWSVSSCPVLDPALCNDSLLWSEPMQGGGAVVDFPLDWTQFIDLGTAQNLLLRLRVWNPGEEADELFHYAYFQYVP
jgi:hypothetical protein